MAQEMTLNLKLSGVQDLLKAIRQLNTALTSLNNKFTGMATAITAAANKISQTTGQVKTQAYPQRNNASGRPGGMGTVNAAASTYSNVSLFRALLGHGTSGFANLLGNLANKFSGVNVGKFLPPLFTGTKGGAGAASIFKLGDVLNKVGPELLLIRLAVDAVVGVFKLFVSAMNEVGKVVTATAQLLWSAGGDSLGTAIRGLGAAAGMSASQMAQIAHDPIHAKILMQQLKALRGMNPESAAIYANQMGIDPNLARQVNKMSDMEWQQANGKGPMSFLMPGKASNAMADRAATDWTSAVGEFKDSLSQLWQTLSPVLEVFALWLKGVALILRMFAKTIEIVIINFVKLMDQLIPWAHIGDSVKAFESSLQGANEQLDKFTNKTGTFGGRERAQSPIPSAWTYYAYQGQLINHKNTLGAFEF